MQITETLSDGLRRAYAVTLPAEQLESRRAARLLDLGRTLQLPGFRPGKVPIPVVKQRYGAAVASEVLEQSVTEATEQLLTDRGLRPAMQPKVEIVGDVASAAAPGQDLTFNVELEVLPEITIPDFKDIALTRLRAEVSDTAIAESLTQLSRRNREAVDVAEDRGARPGDLLTFDYDGRIGGEPFEGGSGKGATVEMGVAESGYVPGFAEQLDGIKDGETRTFTVVFPETYGESRVAGKEAEFTVRATKLQHLNEPTVDDAYAERIGFGTLEELRDFIRSQLLREYDKLARLWLKRKLLDALAERATFGPPDGMVESEFQSIWARVEADRKAGQVEEEDRNKDEATIRAEFRAIADRRVRLGLLLAEIGRLNGIVVGAEEMQRAMRAEAGRYPGQEAQVMDLFRKNPQAAEGLRGPIFEDKVIDYILELASVTEQVVPPEELVAAARDGTPSRPNPAANSEAPATAVAAESPAGFGG